jgi:hypothetical protein
MVPVTVCAQPDCPSCAVGGGATAPAGPLKPQPEPVPQPRETRKPPMQVIPPANPPAAEEPAPLPKQEGAPQTQPSAGPKV